MSKIYLRRPLTHITTGHRGHWVASVGQPLTFGHIGSSTETQISDWGDFQESKPFLFLDQEETLEIASKFIL